MELRQTGSLEAYIQDFDVLRNKADFSEKQAKVFFIRGLELEIKNPVKMFDPKAFKQVYNIAHLEDNTLAYRRSHSQPYQTHHKYTSQVLPQTTHAKQHIPLPYSRHITLHNFNNLKQPQNGMLPTPTLPSSLKPTKSICKPREKNKDCLNCNLTIWEIKVKKLMYRVK
jgi:hypothetical protein